MATFSACTSFRPPPPSSAESVAGRSTRDRAWLPRSGSGSVPRRRRTRSILQGRVPVPAVHRAGVVEVLRHCRIRRGGAGFGRDASSPLAAGMEPRTSGTLVTAVGRSRRSDGAGARLARASPGMCVAARTAEMTSVPLALAALLFASSAGAVNVTVTPATSSTSRPGQTAARHGATVSRSSGRLRSLRLDGIGSYVARDPLTDSRHRRRRRGGLHGVVTFTAPADEAKRRRLRRGARKSSRPSEQQRTCRVEGPRQACPGAIAGRERRRPSPKCRWSRLHPGR